MFAATCRTPTRPPRPKPSFLSSSSSSIRVGRRGGSFGWSRQRRFVERTTTTIEDAMRKKTTGAHTQRGVAVVVRGGHAEIAQLAGFDGETLTTVLAAVLGIAAGLGIPIFFVTQENRDKERIEEIRELNRATLKATGEQMSEEEIGELRPERYLDRREFKDDD